MTELNNGKADIDKILSIKGVRDYYDDGDLDKKEFDKLYQKLLNNQAIVDEIKKLAEEASIHRDITIGSICKQLLETTYHSKCLEGTN